ncbi:hypothetical protein [Haladaptatus cibarius]|nr:hypothetical protein [Haladaptatus cibarius]
MPRPKAEVSSGTRSVSCPHPGVRPFSAQRIRQGTGERTKERVAKPRATA